jgi:hypothetical protein
MEVESETSAIHLRLQQWAAAAPVLQEVRDADIRKANTRQALRLLTGSILQAAARLPMREGSGLVEQQRLFRKVVV